MVMIPVPTKIFHITHIDNLPSIIQQGGLYANSQKELASYVNIAHSSIQNRRRYYPVPIAPGGNLHDYVPFYFAPRSPMLYSIHMNRVEGYSGGQRPVIYMVSSVQAVEAKGLDFVFTDGHAIMFFSNFFNDISKLSVIDWEIMQERYWADTEDDNDRCRRRQAEFLVFRFFPWNLIEEIVVYDEIIAQAVGNILRNGEVITELRVNREWYY